MTEAQKENFNFPNIVQSYFEIGENFDLSMLLLVAFITAIEISTNGNT